MTFWCVVVYFLAAATSDVVLSALMDFFFQLRSLYPDKEHEAKYTELVRGYLDFDVEMEQIGAFWRHSESLLKEFNNQQNELRQKQKMFRQDLERFKRSKLEAATKHKDNMKG